MDRLDGEDRELTRRLRAYAAERLSPDPAWSAATRDALVRAAADQSLRQAPGTAREDADIFDLDEARRRRTERAPRIAAFRRRVVAGLLAAALTIAGVGAVLGADSSSALYPARLWLETVTLPQAPADDLARLDRRIQDATDAASNGRGEGVSAALAAYRESLQDAIDAAGNDPERLQHLHDALDAHTVALETLAGSAPAGAADAIDKALKANADAATGSGDRTRPSTKP